MRISYWFLIVCTYTKSFLLLLQFPFKLVGRWMPLSEPLKLRLSIFRLFLTVLTIIGWLVWISFLINSFTAKYRNNKFSVHSLKYQNGDLITNCTWQRTSKSHILIKFYKSQELYFNIRQFNSESCISLKSLVNF